jgi:hypothetical protein
LTSESADYASLIRPTRYALGEPGAQLGLDRREAEWKLYRLVRFGRSLADAGEDHVRPRLQALLILRFSRPIRWPRLSRPKVRTATAVCVMLAIRATSARMYAERGGNSHDKSVA